VVGGGQSEGERERGSSWKEGKKVKGGGNKGGLGPILTLQKPSNMGVTPMYGNKARLVVVEMNGDGKEVPNYNLMKLAPKLIRLYRSTTEDLAWARKGVIVSVLNGEAIPVIQTRINDAGFDDLDVILVGADKVFVQSLSNSDVMAVFAEARDFFNLFFSKLVPWNKVVFKFQRGSWLQIYGTPIHT